MREIFLLLAAVAALCVAPAHAQSYELDETEPRIERSLAAMREGQAAGEAGDEELAERRFREALALRTAALGPLHWATGNASLQLALVLDRSERTEEGFAAFEAAIAAYRASRPELLATSLDDYAHALESASRYEEAERLRRESLQALAFSDFTEAEREELAVEWSLRLGTILRWQGRHAEAIPLLEAYLARVDTGSEEDGYRLAVTLFDLAYALAGTGEAERATALYGRIIDTYRARGDLGDGLLVASLLNQTNLHDNAGRFEAAIVTMQQRVDYRLQLGDDPAEIAMDMMRVADLNSRIGRADRAEALLRQALAQYEAVAPPLRLQRLGELVKWAYDAGLPALAEDIARARLELADRSTSLAQRADALTALANLFLDLGRPDEAAPLIARADAILTGSEADLALQRGVVQYVRGRSLTLADPPQAEIALLAAIREFSGLEGWLKANEAVSQGLLGRIYLLQQRHAEALARFENCAALFRQHAPGYRGDIVMCETGGAEALAGTGEVDAAIARFLPMLPLMRRELSDRSPVMIDRLGALGEIYGLRASSARTARHWFRDAGRRIATLTERQATDLEASRLARRFSRIYRNLVATDWQLAQQASNTAAND